MASTAPLQLYIQRALEEPSAEVFSHSEYMPPPTLIKGPINYILAFRGCFNPPHQGHKDTLYHGFFRGGKHIRLIAAIILPLDDYSVSRKYSHQNLGAKDVVLTLQERINLSNNSGLYGGWHWCHPRGARGSEAFKRRLISEAAKDGFTIQFVTLTGPDHVRHDFGSAGHQGPTIVVGTGDQQRTSLRMERETGLRKLSHYNDWKMEALEEMSIQQLGAGDNLTWLEQKLSMLFPLATTNLPRDRTYCVFYCMTTTDCKLDKQRLQTVKDRLRIGVWRLGETRACRRSTGSPTEWMRYVPTRFFGMTGGVWFLGSKEEQSSSSRLHYLLASPDDADQLKKAQLGNALSPQLLLQYIQSHGQ
jgi:hypothetical protein